MSQVALELARSLLPEATFAVSWGGRVRLIAVMDTPLQRLRASLYAPAYRTTSRAYRLLCAIASALRVEPTPASSSILAINKLNPSLRTLKPFAVIIGTPGPNQSLVAILAHNGVQPSVALKVSVKKGLNERLLQEAEALTDNGLGGTKPSLLAKGELAGHMVLATEFVRGRPLTRLGTKAALPRALAALPTVKPGSTPYPPDRHPWITRIAAEAGIDLNPLAQAMPGVYPSVRLHGDYAPWNLIVTVDNRVCAIDWEHSSTDGLPGIDLAHFIISSIHHLSRKSSRHAADLATSVLVQYLGLSQAEAWATVCLAAAATGLREEGAGSKKVSAFWWAVAHYSLQQLS